MDSYFLKYVSKSPNLKNSWRVLEMIEGKGRKEWELEKVGLGRRDT